jgi:hypothetical protein
MALIVLILLGVIIPWTKEGAALRGIVKERRLAHRLAGMLITQLEHSEQEEPEDIADQIRRSLTHPDTGFEEGRMRSCRRVFDIKTRELFIQCLEDEERLFERIDNIPRERARLAELRSAFHSEA